MTNLDAQEENIELFLLPYVKWSDDSKFIPKNSISSATDYIMGLSSGVNVKYNLNFSVDLLGNISSPGGIALSGGFFEVDMGGDVISGEWKAFPIGISYGGMGASLSPSEGGIFYSTATSGAILNGIPNANKVVLSGSNAPPVWSNATYPASTNINRLLYSSANNVISELITASNGVLITDSGGVPSIGNTLPLSVQNNITQLGDIISGAWKADVIGGAYGGTGIDNGTSTITIGGDIVFTGSSLAVFSITAPTNVVFPTSGTLATVSEIPNFPLSLSNGGTGDSLTANDGGIFYSTATAGAILAGTSLAGRLFTSGANSAPSWTTSTYPSTNPINTLLYASSANTMSALATANNGVLVTSGAGAPSIGSTLPSAVQSNITNLGTISSGIWNGNVISPTYGGTGVNNGSSTLTLSGGFNANFTLTGPTNVTFPTSGTLATTSGLPSFPLSLAQGGTQAALTASNGGIFYSTATTGAILSGTPTGNQVLLSGSSSAPSWSSATYPSSTSINQILYSSAANTISGLSTATNSVLVTNGGGAPSLSATLPTAVQSNITQLGTISSGIWNGSVIGPTYGGTGVNNGASTLTLGGNLTTAGAFNSIFNITGPTSVIFPTSGTLATTASIPSLPLSITNGGTGLSTTPTVGQILSGTAGNIWAIGDITSSATSITITPDGSGNINLDADPSIIAYLANANTFTDDQTIDPTKTLFATNITGNSKDFTINPDASGDYIHIGRGLASAVVDVGTNCTSTNFIVVNSTNILFEVFNGIVTTQNNVLDDTTGKITSGGDIQAGNNLGGASLISISPNIANGSLRLTSINNSGSYDVTISNVSHGQSTVYSIPDVGAITGQILNKTSAFVNGNIISASGTAGVTVDGGVAANKILTSSITNPDVSSDLIYFSVTVGQAALASGGSVTLQASSGSKQYRIIKLQMNSGGTNFSGGLGNRNGQITDGTTVYTVIPAANMQLLANNEWGSVAIPYPASAAINTATVAGQAIVFKYSGGTTDYTSGSVVISGLLVRVA